MNEREYDVMCAVEARHWWYAGLHELIVRRVAREQLRLGRPLEILDAGCGSGRLAELLRPFGRVVGCDCSERALAHARGRGVEVFVADLNDADLGEARFDVVTAIDVLYHRAIRDDRAVVQRLARALRPGGLLILNLPAYEWLRSRHDRAVHTRQRYTRSTLLPLLTGSGLSVETLCYRLAPLLPLVAAQRLAQRSIDILRPQAEAISDVKLPSAWVNRLLLGVVRLENRLVERGRIPWGSSLYAVARRPLQPGEVQEEVR